MEKLVDRDPIKNDALSVENFPLPSNTSACFFCQYGNICGIKDV